MTSAIATAITVPNDSATGIHERVARPCRCARCGGRNSPTGPAGVRADPLERGGEAAVAGAAGWPVEGAPVLTVGSCDGGEGAGGGSV